jgi:hypothetical protein
VIRYLKQDEIDKTKWDDCIKHAFNGLVYGYSWYLDLVSPGWEALVEDDYIRIFPLTCRSKFGISYLYQPFFTQQLGIFSRVILNGNVVDSFIQAIPSKYRFAEINLNVHNKIDPSKYTTVQMVNHELDLISSYEGLYKRYSQNIKRNIKKAASAGVSIVKNVHPEEIIGLFMKNKGREIVTLREKDYAMLKRVVYTCLHKGLAQVWGAYTEANDLCAGAIFVPSHKKAIFLFSVTNEIARENGAMSLLISTFIKEHAGSHLTLDFEGSNDPDLARFYKSFGSSEMHYPQLHINRLPPVVAIGVRMVKKIRRALK